MRYTQAEKLEVIRLVEGSDLPAKRTLSQLGVIKSTFYEWFRRYQEEGAVGLLARPANSLHRKSRLPRVANFSLNSGRQTPSTTKCVTPSSA